MENKTEDLTKIHVGCAMVNTHIHHSCCNRNPSADTENLHRRRDWHVQLDGQFISTREMLSKLLLNPKP